MSSPTMTAIGVPRYGGPDVLTTVQVPIPTVGPKQVLVRVAAAGINPADAAIRSGQFRFFIRRPFPLVVGSDIAGTVHELGDGATRFAVGDRVHGLMPLFETGAYAEYAVINESDLAPIPARLTMAEAAAVPLAALTAHQALVGRGRLRAGQRVLVTGASGGVGTFAVQIAATLGAHVVTLTSARNLELVAELGAKESVDYAEPGVLDRIAAVDIILDCARSLTLSQSLRLLARGGTYVSIVPIANVVAIARAALRGRRYRWAMVKPDGATLAQIDSWIDEGTVTPVVERLYSPAEAAAAHEHIESRRTRGKIVLDLTESWARMPASS